MRIAQCEYYWPDELDEDDGADTDAASTCALEAGEFGVLSNGARSSISASGESLEEEEDPNSPAATARRLASPELKSVVRRLLERLPAQRARLLELWGEPWLRGEGAPLPPLRARRSLLLNNGRGEASGKPANRLTNNSAASDSNSSGHETGANGYGYDVNVWANGVDKDDAYDLENEGDPDPGVLLDEEHIASVASQELEPL